MCNADELKANICGMYERTSQIEDAAYTDTSPHGGERCGELVIGGCGDERKIASRKAGANLLFLAATSDIDA